MQDEKVKNGRNQKIIEDYMSDITIKELVSKYHLTKQSIYTIIKNSGYLPKKPQKNKDEIQKRNQDIIDSYTTGTPMPELASKYELTRQGIQLILKAAGLDAKKGGASIRAKIKRIELLKNKKNSKDSKCKNKWGCTHEQWEELRNKDKNFHLTPIARYIQHRSNVKRDNITWNISLWDWWNIWSSSGKYDERGRGKYSYCMTRKNNRLGYTKENVVITKVSENLKVNTKK